MHLLPYTIQVNHHFGWIKKHSTEHFLCRRGNDTIHISSGLGICSYRNGSPSSIRILKLRMKAYKNS